MSGNFNKVSLRIKKAPLIAAAGVGLVILAIITANWYINSIQQEHRKREEIVDIFETYEPYGLVYDKEKDRLYYNGELVRYFEDIVNADHYLKWPNLDGKVDVYTKRNASGALVSVNTFRQQEFSDRTPSLESAIYELEICDLETANTISCDGYTAEVEETVKERIAEEYEVYQQYGLTYNQERDRLYYGGELVGYFQDKQIGHYFGPFDDSSLKIYAVRDRDHNLSGLDIDDSLN